MEFCQETDCPDSSDKQTSMNRLLSERQTGKGKKLGRKEAVTPLGLKKQREQIVLRVLTVESSERNCPAGSLVMKSCCYCQRGGVEWNTLT